MEEKIHVSIVLKEKTLDKVERKRDGSGKISSGLEVEMNEKMKEGGTKTSHYEILGNRKLRWLVEDYEFENIFPASTSQKDLYHKIGYPIVHKMLQGVNCTIIAYGDTRSEKEETLIGDRKYTTLNDGEIVLPADAGLLPRIGCHLWESIRELRMSGIQTEVTISFIDIFSLDIRDLFGKGEVRTIRETQERGIYLKDLTSHVVSSFEEMMKYYQIGHHTWLETQAWYPTRHVFSNRIFTISLKQRYQKDCNDNENNHDFELVVKESDLQFILMQGSEQQTSNNNNTTSSFSRTSEFTKIYCKNMMVFTNIISALADNQNRPRHFPYRNSQFTRLLSTRLNSNCSFYALVNIFTDENFQAESLSCLRFASLMRLIDQHPTINEVNFSNNIAQQQLKWMEITVGIEEKKRQLMLLAEESSERDELVLSVLFLEETRKNITRSLTMLQKRYTKERLEYDFKKR